MKTAVLFLLVCCLVLTSAVPNTILFRWTNFISQYVRLDLVNVETREAALLAIAAHDALAAVSLNPLYEPIYFENNTGYGGGDQDAAVNAAFYTMWIYLFSSRTQPLNTAVLYWPTIGGMSLDTLTTQVRDFYYSQIEGITATPQQIITGVNAGASAASAVYQARLTDGWDTPKPWISWVGNCPFAPCPDGQYFPPIPSGPQAGVPYYQWENMTMFSGRNSSYWRAPPPAEYLSRAWNNTAEITFVYGDYHNPLGLRTKAMDDSVRFWAEASPMRLSPILTQALANQLGWDLVQSARILALMLMAQNDAIVVQFNNKLLYQAWRPWQAFNPGTSQQSDYIGNPPRPNANLAWTPYYQTPLNPEYPPGHTLVFGSGNEVLRELGSNGGTEFYFNPPLTINVPSTTVPSETLSATFTSLTELDDDVMWARIWGGMHFHLSLLEGLELGQRLAKDLVEQRILSLF